MATLSVKVYTGVWTDWSKGPILGATLTLKTQVGVLLLAFVASFVTLIAARLWRICRFIAHQLLSDERIHDGLYFQRQSILRNAHSPFETAWKSLQQWWYWRDAAHKVHRRTIPTALITLAYVAIFLVVAVFSAKVSDAASKFRLVRSEEGRCGILDVASPSDTPVDDQPLEEKEKPLRAVVAREREQNKDADTYARECYEAKGDHTRSGTEGTSSYCDILAAPSLPWDNTTIDCPFGDLCIEGAALRLETKPLDTGKHMGVNQPRKNQIQYRKRTECAPLKLQFVETERLTWIDSATNETIERCLELFLYYGPIIDVVNNTVLSNYTYNVITCSHPNGVSQFTAGALSAWGGAVECPICNNGDQGWQSLAGLTPTNRDVTLIFILSNAVRHTAPNKDLIFATGDLDNTTSGSRASKFYRPRSPVGVLACAESHQICNPQASKCTDFVSAPVLFNMSIHADLADDLGLSAAQTAVAFNLAGSVATTGMYHMVYTRLGSLLKAQTGSSQYAEVELADNQWEVESAGLFATGLARLQREVLDWTGGAEAAAPEGLVKNQPWKDERWLSSFAGVASAAGELEALCHSQMVRSTDGTLSFSLLGLGIVFGVGGLIVLLSVIIEPLTGHIQKKTGRGLGRGAAWERDGNLQMQRLLFEERGQGEWVGVSASVPRTKNRTSLRLPAEIGADRDRMMLFGRGQRLSLSGRESEEMG